MNRKTLLISIVILLVASMPAVSSTSWWNSSWEYRMPISINNTQAVPLYDYQIQLNFNASDLVSSGKLRNDCGDIRFVDSSNVQLSYWNETFCTNNMIIWVKIPFINSSSETKIYMYYGNPSATSVSNGKSTFIYFDDFDDSSFNSTMWYTSSGSWTESNGYVSFASSSITSYIAAANPAMNLTNISVVDRIMVTGTSQYGDYRFGLRLTPLTNKYKSVILMTRIGNTGSHNCNTIWTEDYPSSNSSSASTNCYSINTWHRRELLAFGDYFEGRVNGNFVLSLTTPHGNAYGTIYTFYSHNNGPEMRVDYIFARNLFLPEPFSASQNEEKIPSILFFNPMPPVVYPTQVNATCLGTFLRNGTDISSENGIYVTLPAGVWNYTCVNGTNVESQLYTVNKASTNLSLTFDPSSPIAYGTQMKATCTEDSEGTAVFLRNGTAYAYNDTYVVWPAGAYNFTCYVPETQNYTAASSSSIYTINKKSTSLSLSFNPSSPIIYETQMKATCTEDSEASASFTRNGTAYAYNDTFVILQAGIHFFNCTVPESQNYTSASSTSNYAINKKNLGVTLIVNNSSSGQYYYLKYPNGVYAEAIADSNLNNLGALLYRNGSSVSNPYTAQLSYGWWNFTAVSQGNENYTSASQERLVYSGQLPEVKIWYPNSTVYFYPWSSKNIPVAANATSYFSSACKLSINKGANQSYACNNYNPLKVENGWLNVTYSDAAINTYDKNLGTYTQYYASVSGMYLQHWFRLPNSTFNPFWNYTMNVSTKLHAYQYGISIEISIWNYDTSSWNVFWWSNCPIGQVCEFFTYKSLNSSYARNNEIRLRSWWGSQGYNFYLYEVYIPNVWYNVLSDYHYNVQYAGNHSFDFYAIESNTGNEANDSKIWLFDFVSVFNITNNRGQPIQSISLNISNSTHDYQIVSDSPVYLNNTLLPKGNVTISINAPNYIPYSYSDYITDSYHVYNNITLTDSQLKIKVFNEQSLSSLPWYKLYITNATGTGKGSYTSILTVGKGYPSTPFSNVIDGNENTFITTPVNITYNFGYTNATFRIVYDSTSAGSLTIRIWNEKVGVFDTVKSISVGGPVSKTYDTFTVDNSPKIQSEGGGDYKDLFYYCLGYYCPLFEISPSGGVRVYEMKLVAPYTYDENGFVSANYTSFGMATGTSSLIFRSPLAGSASNFWGQRQYFISPQSYQETELVAFLNPFCYTQNFRVLEYNPQNPTQPIQGAMLSVYKEFEGQTYIVDQYMSDSQGNARLCVESGYPYTFVAQKQGYDSLVSYDHTFAFTETVNVYLSKATTRFYDFYLPARNVTCNYNGKEELCQGNIMAPNVTVKCSIFSSIGNIYNMSLIVIKDSRNWNYPPMLNGTYPPDYDNATLPFNLNDTYYEVVYNETNYNPYGATLSYLLTESGYYTYQCSGYFRIVNSSLPLLEGRTSTVGFVPGSFSLNANVMAPAGTMLVNFITPGGLYLFMLLVNLGVTGFFISRFGISGAFVFLLSWGLTLTLLGGWGFNFQTGMLGIYLVALLLVLAFNLSPWRR